MKPEEKIVLIKYRLDKSDKTMQAASLLFQNDFNNSVFNRVYYACFYAVTALLLCKDLASSKHSGIKSMFNLQKVIE